MEGQNSGLENNLPNTDRMENLVECSVCLSDFVRPKVLDCGHSLCENCCKELVEKKGSLKCPECRATTNRCYQDLPTNFALMIVVESKLLELHIGLAKVVHAASEEAREEAKAAAKKHKCLVCEASEEEKKGEWMCNECRSLVFDVQTGIERPSGAAGGESEDGRKEVAKEKQNDQSDRVEVKGRVLVRSRGWAQWEQGSASVAFLSENEDNSVDEVEGEALRDGEERVEGASSDDSLPSLGSDCDQETAVVSASVGYTSRSSTPYPL